MSRKRKLEAPPIESFKLNGVEVELRDETCWRVGSGQASALEHYLSIKKPIYAHINEILFEDAETNKLRVTGIQEVKKIFATPTNFAKQCAMCNVGCFWLRRERRYQRKEEVVSSTSIRNSPYVRTL